MFQGKFIESFVSCRIMENSEDILELDPLLREVRILFDCVPNYLKLVTHVECLTNLGEKIHKTPANVQQKDTNKRCNNS